MGWNMRKTVAYIRVSGKGQVKGDGPTRQKSAINSWAKDNKTEVVAWYQELGVSGTMAERPALARMLVDIEHNHKGVELVLVEGLHRLARDLLVQETILHNIWGLGLDVLPVDSGIGAKDGEEPSRKLIRQIMGAVAEYEKVLLEQKLRAARERIRAKEGRCEGRKPFGYYPGEQQTLEVIRQLRRSRGGKRLSYQKIADELNARGRPTRQGRPWGASAVQAIIKKQMPSLA